MKLESPPTIPSLAADGKPRPFWSVMIPAYNPPATYLAESLRSILAQHPGPERMQIEVVDDCSPKVDVAALVKTIAGERVKVSQTPKNLGLAGCWNTCIERARGEWVHLLHQDDVVLPGFYQRLASVTQSPAMPGMGFCRFAVMDGNGHWHELGPLEQNDPGVLDNWLERVMTGHHVECPTVVIKRSVYEHLGGFNGQLNFALDLEMWIRVAAHYPVAYEPTILACYRRHAGNETARLEQGGGNMLDVARAMEHCQTYLPPEPAGRLIAQAQAFWAGIALELAEKAYAADRLNACVSHLDSVQKLCDQGKIRRQRIKLAAKAALKRTLGPKNLAAIRRVRSSK